VGALPGRVVYLVPTVITVKSTAGEIAKGEALGPNTRFVESESVSRSERLKPARGF